MENNNEIKGRIFLLNPDNYSINEYFAKTNNKVKSFHEMIDWVHYYLHFLGIKNSDLIVSEISPLWHHDNPNGVRIKCSDPNLIFEYFPEDTDDEYNHMYNAYIEEDSKVIPVVSKDARFSSADAAYIACEKYLKEKTKVLEPVPSASMEYDHHMVFEFTYGLPNKYTFIIQEAGFEYK